MFVIAIPKNETSGKCRINGEEAVFIIHDGRFEFRTVSDKGGKRRIMMTIAGEDDLITYVCE